MQELLIKRGRFVGGQVDADGVIDILEHFKSQF
jgi:hypothetical protein